LDPAVVSDDDQLLGEQAMQEEVEDGSGDEVRDALLELSSGEVAIAGEQAEQLAFAFRQIIGRNLWTDKSSAFGMPEDGPGSGIDIVAEMPEWGIQA
jgi:hypothetical protein